MGVYVVKEEAPWWQKLLGSVAASAGTGLVSGMFERDKMARQAKADAAKAQQQHDWDLEKLGVQADYAASQKQKDFDNQLQLANLNNEHALALADRNNRFTAGQNALTRQFNAGQNDLNRALDREKLANALSVARIGAEKSAAAAALNRQKDIDVANIRANGQREGAQNRAVDSAVQSVVRSLASDLSRTPEELAARIEATVGPDMAPAVISVLSKWQNIPGIGGVGTRVNPLWKEQPQSAVPEAQEASQQGASFTQGDSLKNSSSFKKGKEPFAQPQAQAQPVAQAPAARTPPPVVNVNGRAFPLSAQPQEAAVNVSNSPLAGMAKKYGVSPQALEEFIRARQMGL